MKTILAALILALPLIAAAQAQTVWRCGADGRSYSGQPCSSGRALEQVEARPATDVQAARELAARERRLADSLVGERLRAEASVRGNGLGGFPTSVIKPMPKAVPKHRPHKTRPPADPDIWQATVPASRRTKG